MSQYKILIVEDDAIESMDIKNRLELLGYEVPYVATRGPEAVEKASELTPDLVLMDITLKGDMDGIEAAQEIIKLDIPIIYLTAHSDEATVQKAKLTGPYGYIIKPYEPNELKFTLEIAIYKSKIDKKLKKSETISKALLNASSDYLVLIDTYGNFLSLNNSASTGLGFTEKELIGTNFKEYVNPKLSHIIKKYIEKAIKLRKQVEFEDNMDGIYFNHRISPIIEGNEVTKLAIFSQNITSKKLAQKKTIESEKQYRTIFNNTGSGTVIFDKNGLILMVNSEWEKISGYSKEEVEGKVKWAELVHPDYLDLMIEYGEKRHEGDSSIPSHYETCFVKKDGSPLHMYVSVAPLPEKEQWLASSIDITDLKKAREKLSLSEERLKLALKGASAALFDLDITTGNAYLSPEYYQMFGYEPGEFPADFESWTQIIHPADLENATSNLTNQIQNKKEQLEIEYRAICKDGTEKWILGMAKGVEFDENGIATRIIGVNLDMSERKALEEKLELIQYSVDKAQDLIFWIDSQGKIVYANEAATSKLGYSQKEFQSMTIFNEISPDFDAEKWQEHWNEIKKVGQKTMDIQIPAKDGKLIDMSLAVNLIDFKGTLYHCDFARDITQQKEMERQLIESQRKLETLMSNLPGMAYRCKNDPQWTMIFVSEGILELSGYLPEDLVNNHKLSYGSLIHPEDQKQVWNIIQTSLAKKEAYELTYRIITSDSQTKFVWEKGRGIFSSEGELLALEGFVSDITEKQKAQQSLKEQYDFIQYLMDSIPSPIFYKDMNYRYQGCNKAFEELFNLSKDHIIGKTVYEINPPELADKFHAKDQDLLNNPGTQTYEAPVQGGDGSLHDILFIKNTFNDIEGNLAGLIGVMSDVTDMKKAEKALRRSENEYREVFENINTAVAVYEVVGNGENFIIKDFNRAGTEIEKVTRKDIIGKKITEIFPGVEEFGILEVFKRVWKTGQPERFPLSFYKDERISGWRENYIYKLPSGEVVAVYDDLTQQKQAEEEIELNEKRLKSLVRILQYNPKSVQDLLDYALEESIKLTKSKLGYIYHYYPDKEYFILNTWSEGVMKECTVKKVPEVYKLEKTGIWGEAVRQRKPFIINDFQAPHPLKKGYPEGHAPLYKYMTMPVFSREDIVAVVGVANKDEDYTETDLLQLELLMDAVWKIVDRQKAEKALKVSETEYKAIFENTGTATAISEDNMILSLANEEFARLTGYSKEEIENKMTWTAFFVEEQIERMKKYHKMRRIDPEKVPKNYESQVIDKKGNIKDVYMSVSLIPNTKKSLVSVLDITERKQSRKMLERELKINKALANIYSPIISPDSSIEDISVAILEESQGLTGSEHGYVSSIDPKTGDNIGHSLTRMMSDCQVMLDEKRIAFPIGPDGIYGGLWGHSLNTGESFFTNTPQTHDSAKGIPEGHLKLKNFLSVPVFLGTKLVGQIALANSTRNYSQKDIEAIERIAEFYALAIHSKNTEKEIKDSLEEKETLLREIHHRVKNNMQIISSLLNLQKYVDTARDPLELIEDSQNRIKTMSIVHELLYQSGKLSKVNLKTYIEKLSHYLFEQYSASTRKITLWTDLEENYLNIETAVPCCLIVNELISNSLKHAFPSDTGEIRISFHKINEHYELIVGDNGIGLPPDIDMEKTSTLGLYLVNSLVNQIDGSLDIKNKDGAQFKIVFKELVYAKRI